MLATALTAGVSGVLLWLGWLLVGNVVAATPDLPPGATVTVEGVRVTAGQWSDLLREASRDDGAWAAMRRTQFEYTRPSPRNRRQRFAACQKELTQN